ncbi:NAD(P)H-binding protein, partial [Paraglaciecola sp.]|uniref:NAD(P)-dependent oxidoreductase n=1 Tax=Paraglaciecola sp. TaxID=1920173 RepID=UPI0030F48DB9
MKIAVLGATGWVGSHIVAEAITRNHQVIALVRDLNKAIVEKTTVREFDLTKDSNFMDVVVDADVIIASIGGRAAGNHEMVAQTAQRLLKALDKSHKRLLWVGGAGSLEVAPGVTLSSTAEFPSAYKDEALAQGEALNVFKHNQYVVNWIYFSPAALLYPGGSEGEYRIGGDQFFTNEQGESKISVSDFAKAM